MKTTQYFLASLLFFFTSILMSQETLIFKKGITFSVKISVVDVNNTEITNNVNIYSNGVVYDRADFNGSFIIKGQVDSQIRVEHPDFETVYYTLRSNEDIKIVVKDYAQRKKRYQSSKQLDPYLSHIDSAKFYKQKNIEKSVSFIEKALSGKQNKKQNATTYKLLAEIYFYWEQYDLAEYNFKLSDQIYEDVATKISIAKTQLKLKKYIESKIQFQKIDSKKLTNYQKLQVYEGLGDVFFIEKAWEASRKNYTNALTIAKENSIASKITDLNSKLADVYAAEGNINQAENLFKKTINLAEKESPTRVLKQEEKVANFYNTNKRFDDEIQLRKRSLERAKQKKVDPKSNKEEDSITSQKINYKIGRAYLQKDDVKKAIPFLEQSKKDAKKNKDIVVEKDATRKISEAFANIGEYDKALRNYEEYVKLVDTLYIQKEQEIQQVKRFSKKIADNQNRITSLEKDKELAESKISLAYIDQKLSEEVNRNQKNIISALISVISLLILLAWFMFRNNRQQKLANNLLALKSMRSQMNPHFIFNALNSVNSFIAVNDERNANRYLSEFSALMRAVLENSDEDFIPLSKEVELLELYVKLEHNRFKDKFDYAISIDEKINLEEFTIPPMLLQPYIENAIWHGLRYRKEKGVLEISINQKNNETLVITIKDDGIGRAKSQALKTKNQLKQKSKGMSTIKNRISILNDMYKERVSVEVNDVFDDGKGTKVELLLKKK